MKPISSTLLFCLFCLFGWYLPCKAHLLNDSTASTPSSNKSTRNFRFSILGGPGYTPDYGVVLGGGALFTFTLDPDDPLLQRSVIPVSIGLTFAKPLGISFIVKPQFYFKGNQLRLWGSVVFKNVNENYYGVGYQRNRSVVRSRSTTQYFTSSLFINPIFQFRIPDTDYFIGPMLDFTTDHITKVGNFVSSDPIYERQGGNAEGINLRTVGVGAVASYDSRDVASNAYRGRYFELKGGYYSRIFGGDTNYGYFSFDYRQYLKLPKLGKKSVLAWTAITKNAFGNIPFTKYPLIGSPNDLRGYYLGQYRNRTTLVSLAEYRHIFDFGNSSKLRRFFSHFGFATWAGVGFLGSNPIKYEAVLPNIGAGLRIELQPRMNFRIDMGYSPVDNQTLIYFNITEAF